MKKEKVKKPVSALLFWILCIFIFIGGMGFVSEGNAGSGLFLMILGGLFCPVISRTVKKKWGKKGNTIRIVSMILVFIISATLTTSKEDGNVSDNQVSLYKKVDNKSVQETLNETAGNDSVQNTSENSNVQNSLDDSVKNTNSYDNLEVHFIDVGQGDATLIKCGEHAMLIDAGDNNKGTTVQLYLNKQNVNKLDAVIWTHTDADHIGGADVITTKYDIGTIYMTNRSSDTKTYRDLIDAINYRNYKATNPVMGSSFTLGTAVVTFLGPQYSYSDDNNNSIACLVEYGNVRFLFTGDAETEAEKAIASTYNNLNVDVYKAGHHGSKTSSEPLLLNAATPEYVVISCGEGNSYGHPHAETLNKYRGLGYKVYRTDEQGSIVAVTDGNTITWNASPSETWKAGEPTGSDSNQSTNQQNSTQQNSTQQNGTQQNSTQQNSTQQNSTQQNGTQQNSTQQNSTQQNSIQQNSTQQNETQQNATNHDSNYGTSPDGAVYIGNMNNQKLHKASCKSLPQTQNQILFNTLEEAESAGYTRDNQCKNCKPFN